MAITAPGNFTCGKTEVHAGEEITCTWTASSGDFDHYHIMLAYPNAFRSFYVNKSATSCRLTLESGGDLTPAGYDTRVSIRAEKGPQNMPTETSEAAWFDLYFIVDPPVQPGVPTLLKPSGFEYMGIGSDAGGELVYDKRTTVDIGEVVRFRIDVPADSGADFCALMGKYNDSTYFFSSADVPDIGVVVYPDVRLFEVSFGIDITAGGDIRFLAFTGTGDPNNPTNTAYAPNTITLHVNPLPIQFPPGGRLEQLENRDAKPVFPLTVTEGVFRQRDGKSLERVLAEMELGVTGPAGAAGPGVPTGGAAGQLLAKRSSGDYDTEWVDAPSSGGTTEPGTGGVTSFKGRTGAVTPQSGDYTADQVGAVPTSRKVNGQALSSDITLITCGTADLTAGSSPLAAGTLYGVYEV